jgi:uncharacterized protein (DUF302 family)
MTERVTQVRVEHVVVAANQPYEKVIGALEKRLSAPKNWGEILQPLMVARASWEEVGQAIEAHVGSAGLTIFNRVEHSPLLALAGKRSRAVQYSIGNPWLAVQMTQYEPEAALYAPLRLVVYEDEAGRTFVAYDSFVSLLGQYEREEVAAGARVVQRKLEALVAEVTVGDGEEPPVL